MFRYNDLNDQITNLNIDEEENEAIIFEGEVISMNCVWLGGFY